MATSISPAAHFKNELSPNSIVSFSLKDTGATGHRKRPSASSPENSEGVGGRKAHKVSRACDHCKSKKLRCGGTLPCDVCTKKGLECLYTARYRRGRPPTPPSASSNCAVPDVHYGFEKQDSDSTLSTMPTQSDVLIQPTDHPPMEDIATTARLSAPEPFHEPPHLRVSPPGTAATQVEGHFFDPASHLSFLRRACGRFSLVNGAVDPWTTAVGPGCSQPITSTGDRPLIVSPGQPQVLPDRATMNELFVYYFEQIIVTYRCLNQQYCLWWMNLLLDNVDAAVPLNQGIGHAKAALVMAILSLVTFRRERISGDDTSLRNCDNFFCTSLTLTAEETGSPSLESVQARIFQILYLMQTRRMSQTWYALGTIISMSSSLGLHRKSESRVGVAAPTKDYIIEQCRKRTFWVLYTLDAFLSLMFGRPRMYHDEDIDQDFPDRINDEDMTPQGPVLSDPSMDCHIDSLIFLAKLGSIVGKITREIYSVRPLPLADRLAAAHGFVQQLHEWRDNLPPHLGTIRPSTLVPAFRRQAMTLKTVFAHAIMHAYRPFLISNEADEETIAECIGAARMALETIDMMMTSAGGDAGAILHGFWGAPYITYYALSVIYTWLMQRRATNGGRLISADPTLFDLTDRCHAHLGHATAEDSPSWRYSAILEEFRAAARQDSHRTSPGRGPHGAATADDGGLSMAQSPEGLYVPVGMEIDNNLFAQDSMAAATTAASLEADATGLMDAFTGWQPIDWLELDSSAFGPLLVDVESPTTVWKLAIGAL